MTLLDCWTKNGFDGWTNIWHEHCVSPICHWAPRGGSNTQLHPKCASKSSGDFEYWPAGTKLLGPTAPDRSPGCWVQRPPNSSGTSGERFVRHSRCSRPEVPDESGGCWAQRLLGPTAPELVWDFKGACFVRGIFHLPTIPYVLYTGLGSNT